jgi:hypothetical protein
MTRRGLFKVATVTLATFSRVIGWNSCQNIGLLDQMCSRGSTENCINTCGTLLKFLVETDTLTLLILRWATTCNEDDAFLPEQAWNDSDGGG